MIVEKATHWLRPYSQAIPNIWEYQQAVSRRLLVWATLNVVMGVWFQQRRSKVWRGVGMQSISWGAINAMIAIVGTAAANTRRSRKENPLAVEVVQKEHRNLLWALWINAGLDVLYVIGGFALAKTRGSHDRLARGSGWGIIVQGAFLFVFDVVHAVIMSTNTSKERNS